MKRLVIACVLCTLAGSAAWGGVVIEMEVADPGAAGKAATDTVWVQGKMLRVDPHGSSGGTRMSVLFRDETLWIVDHDKKRCQTIDRKGMQELSARLGGAMKKIEAQLAQLPPEQRAMMERMMQGKMPPGMGQESAPPRRIEVGAVERIGGYGCTVHTLYSGDEKVWEVCAAEEDAVAGAAEAMDAFHALSGFTEQLREIVRQGPFANVIETPFYDMDEVGGIPVRVRTFTDGKVESESTLKSVSRRDLEESVFMVPDGYEVRNLADEIERGG